MNKGKRILILFVGTAVTISLLYLINSPKKVENFNNLLIYNESIDGDYLRGDKSSKLILFDYLNLERESVVKLPSMAESISYSNTTKKVFYLGRFHGEDRGSFQPLVFDLKKSKLYKFHDIFAFPKVLENYKLFDFKINPLNSNEFAFLLYDENKSYFLVAYYNVQSNEVIIASEVIKYKYAPEMTFYGDHVYIFCVDFFNASRLEYLYVKEKRGNSFEHIETLNGIKHIASNVEEQYFVDLESGRKIYGFDKSSKGIKYITDLDLDCAESADMEVIGVILFKGDKNYLLRSTNQNKSLEECYYLLGDNQNLNQLPGCRNKGAFYIN